MGVHASEDGQAIRDMPPMSVRVFPCRSGRKHGYCCCRDIVRGASIAEGADYSYRCREDSYYVVRYE